MFQLIHDRDEAGTSNNNKWWKKLWKLKVPPKVRIFWGRAINNLLLRKGELKRCHILLKKMPYHTEGPLRSMWGASRIVVLRYHYNGRKTEANSWFLCIGSKVDMVSP
jgi:hypothetical protein